MKNVLVLTSVLLAGVLSHAQTSVDATSELYKRFTGFVAADGTPNKAIGTNYVKFKGTSLHGDSCELKIDEYSDKADNGGQLVVYTVDVSYYAEGEVSHFHYDGNPDNARDWSRYYDLSEGMDLALKVATNGQVSRITSPSGASAAGYFGYGGISAWTASKQGAKLVVTQAAKKQYWGSRNVEFSFSPDGSAITSVTLVSLNTNSRYTCGSLSLIPADQGIIAKVKAEKLAEEAEKAKPVSCNSSCSPCTHINGPGSDNTNMKAQAFHVWSSNFLTQEGPAVIGQCDAKKLYDEYPGLKLNYHNQDAVCTSMGDCTHVKIAQIGTTELYCRQTTLVSDKTRPTFWGCVVYDKKTNNRVKDSASLKEALSHLNITLD